MSRLAPLSEEPIINEEPIKKKSGSNGKWRGWVKMKNQFSAFLSLNKKSENENLKILLSVLGCPLFPVPVHTKLHLSQVSSSAHYIIQHFTAATGCRNLTEAANNTTYITGKVTMSMLDDLGSATAKTHGGCFVTWQMAPAKWLIELVVEGHKVAAGCDGDLAWRRTPWLGPHVAPGGVRPLRRALQGLDPVAVSSIFSLADYVGEKQILDVDCFVLKISADQADLANRSDNTAEMIKHVIFGYFSQKSGLLVFLEDSYLTRIQCLGAQPMYWETTMRTKIEDYRMVEGVMIAHKGQSNAIISRFGDNLKAGMVTTRMEEAWTIDDVAFNVPGLSPDCFIPPEEVKKDHPEEKLSWRSTLLR